MRKIINPASVLLEQTALRLAATFYEASRNTGLTSKHKTARHYAAHNIQKFIPHAIVHLRELWLDPNTPDSQRQILHDMFMERIADPMANSLSDASAGHMLPDLEVAKVIPVETLPEVIKDKRASRDFSGLLNSTAVKH